MVIFETIKLDPRFGVWNAERPGIDKMLFGDYGIWRNACFFGRLGRRVSAIYFILLSCLLLSSL